MPLKTCLYPGCANLVKNGYCDKHKNRERFCSYPGCNIKVKGKAYCSKHDPNNRYDLHRGSASKRGYDRDWEKVRDSYRAQHPICERCFAYDRTKAENLVHHIEPLPDGDRLDFDNLMSLCSACHRTLHRMLENDPQKYKKEIEFIHTCERMEEI